MKHFICIILFFSIYSCQTNQSLPDYGKAIIPGTYTSQNGQQIDSTSLQGSILVVDFVFTHCPSICPKMAQQMMRVQEAYQDNENVRIVSFSIDPKNDTVDRLKWYTQKIGVNDDMWSFVRAEKDVIDATSESLKVFQEADESAPGGYNHQSRFILMDQTMTIRGYYDGVNPDDVSKLIADIKQLQ